MISVVMPTFDDYDGVKFTAIDLLINHGDYVAEVVVADNNPAGRIGKAVAAFCQKNDHLKYVAVPEPVGTAPAKNAAIRAASYDDVLLVDCHVLMLPGSIKAYVDFRDANPDKKDDIVHGPMVYDDLQTVDTHFMDIWGSLMWGRFGYDEKMYQGYDRRIETERFFEIWAMGTGCFGVRRDSWLGFNERFRGFGGEEVMIHEQYRQAGRRVWCLSDLRWWHEGFSRPAASRYPNNEIDKARNYIIGLTELGIPLDRAREHFVSSGFSAQTWDQLVADPDKACVTCGGAQTLPATHPLTITSATMNPQPAPARGQVGRPAAWGKRLTELNPLPVSFGISDAGKMYAWMTANGPKASRHLAVHGVELHGEYQNEAANKAAGLNNTALGIMPAVRRYLTEHQEWSVIEYHDQDGGLLVLSNNDEDKPKIEPGAATQAVSFLGSKFRHLLGGRHYLPLPMAEKRLDVCLTCTLRAAGMRCSKCSCHLIERPNGDPGKVFHPHDSCPVGKWLTVEVPKGGFPKEELPPSEQDG